MQKTVFVGLSGGVDSSIAARRLINDGYNVVGVFIKVWHPDFMVCNWEAERLDAMRVAAKLGIPFLTCDAEEAYKREVADYFIAEYKAGRTPNPDVMCNQAVKFGAFLDFATEHGSDYVATGHYVQRINAERPELHRGIDPGKDQSYFLWGLSTLQLEKSLFPIGNTVKSNIRKEAEEAGLLTANKQDSQGICFLGHVDIPEFLSHYVNLEPGAVITENGEKIGEHKGALVYTLGQRHGFTINSHDTARTAMYVVSRDLDANTITVALHKPEITSQDEIVITKLNLRTPVTPGDDLEAQFRYRQSPFEIIVKEVTGDTLTLTTKESIDKPASGQSCVLYRGSLSLGGGIIS
jgi:tRNA-specific 2-thiouridylase